ncbi:MAG: 3-oxoacyl-[acyl-carrier-protein] reductase [Fusobacterium sp.]|jgi:3-oxoacyl-[acyl-carrier protein] reductase|uniref:3-oxoacyl-[acyl-carrier-protein] reductase n=1 Tax=Fusobacterium sp. IOR10 TaxID=2665157 RepID=UPI0013D2B38F|nr:3-oxoacyl-[acyl-carrier-protein] reductase [Fusobacterium sp. IOR10]
MNRIEGKIALVTGGAMGIGRAIVERFASEGAKVVIACDINPCEYEQENIVGKILNVTDREGIKTLVKEVVEEYGTIDILVNNAGITQDGPFVRMKESQWDSVIDINLKGVFNVTQAVAPVMTKHKKGSIITLSSVVGIYGNIGQTNYAATKAGVIGMTQTWKKELARKGAQIRVNCVAPGFIQSPMTEKLSEKAVENILSGVPLKRMGTKEDVANTVLFLASDESSYISGVTIPISGGLSF